MLLYNHQYDAAAKALPILQQYGLVYLSMQVRTGKSLTAMYVADKYGAKAVLFLTKKKAISSIDSDDETLGDYQKLAPAFKLHTTNYEQLHNLSGSDYDLIICDEAHCLGQYPKPAERVKLLKEIAMGKPIIYLSGTPTPESYSQLYHQLWVSSYSPFYCCKWASFYKWAKDFVTIRKKYYYNREINDYSKADKEKIDQLTNHLFVSCTQEEAGFSQEVKEIVIPIRMADSTYLLADYLRKHKVYVGRDGEEILGDTSVKLRNKLHQIYSGTIIDEKGSGKVFDHTKAQYIKDHFAGKKIAVFYKFRAEELMLIWAFGANKITRDPAEFNSRDDLTFISQIQSGREGVNLNTADCMIMLNIDFSAVSYWQARARMQDKNRTKECLLYWLFSDGGIEQKIYKRVLEKKDYTLSHFVKDYSDAGVRTEKKRDKAA